MPTAAKNIVICSDGTGNSYATAPSNVLRLYRLLLNRSPYQLACYDPGVGTDPLPSGGTRVGRRVQNIRALFLGHGVIENVARLYTFLMEQYNPGDRIFLFGFSRGAFTVRALAGLVHVCGLLHREDVHLIRYATSLYETSEARIRKAKALRKWSDLTPREAPVDNAKLDEVATTFKTLLSRDCKITFMGVWDTVKAYGWLRPKSFPALRHNPSVAAVRHAVALDERRSLFQMTGWGDRHSEVKEVWFAGDHSDVGGGHACNSPLTDAAMTWMLGEATHAGLLLDRAQRESIDSIIKNSRLAASTEHNDLMKGRYRVPLPRVELDNSVYPPKRHLRIWPVGVRKPAVHAECSPLQKRTALLFHHTVREHERHDPRYNIRNLLGGRRRTLGLDSSSCEVYFEEDREIAEEKLDYLRNRSADAANS